jgi:tripartite-type tricarboxylate transporter receptor subunit TctC
MLVATGLTAIAAVSAQTFPDKPITLYVGFAPGGAADSVARVVAEEMSKTLGQRVVVDNRAGASGNIATTTVIANPADGYSLLFAAINLATNPSLGGVKYNPQTDLTMVSQMTAVPVVMVVPANSKYASISDVIAFAKSGESALKAASGGVGTSSHLAMELLARDQGFKFLHVPYKGGALANQAILSGDVDAMFDLMSGALKGMIDAGRMKPIAVMQETRVESLPNVKTAKELGLPPTTYIRSWQGIAVRGGTPRPVVDKLHAAVVAAVSSPTVSARIKALGSDVVSSPKPEAFQQLYLDELKRWTALITAAGIKAE